jgi:3-phosphoshikimate 1-carboxyvinyltransferase
LYFSHRSEASGVSVKPRIALPASKPLIGRIRVPGDKSIAHRAVLFNAIARGSAEVSGLPSGDDVRSTIRVCRALGCDVRDRDDSRVTVTGRAMQLESPQGVLDCGNSGTTMRLVMGLLAGTSVEAVLDGDASLCRRPMERVAAPLRAMGANVVTDDGHAPVRIGSAPLSAMSHELSVASAQLKSALLLAGLSASGETVVTEPAATRDHTELMLAAMGVAVARRGKSVAVVGPSIPAATDVFVPGDPSSAAFFAVAATIVPGSELVVEDVCLNPTRTGFVEVLQRMGGDVRVVKTGVSGGEEVGEIHTKASRLCGTVIEGEEIPRCIDEVPVLAVAAACATGTTEIRDAGELRVKESDRIATVAAMLGSLGCAVSERPDGLTIEGLGSGGGVLSGGATVSTDGDHRLVMSAFVAALAADSRIEVDRADSAGISFPEFFRTLEELTK